MGRKSYKELYFELVKENKSNAVNVNFVNNADQIDKIKWQIHAETSVTQIMLWLIVARLLGGWFIWILAGIFIIGNLYTIVKSVLKLGSTYYKYE